MKHVLLLTVVAALLFSACAPKPENQGGAFDSSLFAPQRPAPVEESGLRASPFWRDLRPETEDSPFHAPSELLPDEDDSEDGPKLLFPRKNTAIHI